MIDLSLDGDDGFPVSATGTTGLITKETEFLNTDDYFNTFSWFAIKSFVTPRIGCIGDVLNSNYFGVPLYNAPLPDRLVFCRWGSIAGQVWDYTITPTDSILGDSALAYWWNPKTLAANEGYNAVSHYGLLEISTLGELGLTAPERLEVSEEGWTPNPFTALAVVYNSGDEELEDVSVTITLQYPGLRFYGEATPTYVKNFTIPSILPGEYGTVAFPVEAIEEGIWEIKVEALEETIIREVEVPRIPVEVVIIKSSVLDTVYVGDEFKYTILIQNISTAKAYNLTVIDNLPENAEFISASVSQGTIGRFGNTLEWVAGDLDGGQQATAAITVKALAIGTITNTATVYGDNVIPDSEANISTINVKSIGSLGTGPVVKDKCANSLVISINNTTEVPVTIEIILRQTPCCIENERKQTVTIPANCIKNYIWGRIPAVYELIFKNVEEGIYIWTDTRVEDSRAPGKCSSFIAANRFVHSELILLN